MKLQWTSLLKTIFLKESVVLWQAMPLKTFTLQVFACTELRLPGQRQENSYPLLWILPSTQSTETLHWMQSHRANGQYDALRQEFYTLKTCNQGSNKASLTACSTVWTWPEENRSPVSALPSGLGSPWRMPCRCLHTSSLCQQPDIPEQWSHTQQHCKSQCSLSETQEFLKWKRHRISYERKYISCTNISTILYQYKAWTIWTPYV